MPQKIRDLKGSHTVWTHPRLPRAVVLSGNDNDRNDARRYQEQQVKAGDTYEEAARYGREVLELLVESFQAEARLLPAPHFYESSIETADS